MTSRKSKNSTEEPFYVPVLCLCVFCGSTDLVTASPPWKQQRTENFEVIAKHDCLHRRHIVWSQSSCFCCNHFTILNVTRGTIALLCKLDTIASLQECPLKCNFFNPFSPNNVIVKSVSCCMFTDVV